jgi:hypothetical protein
MPRTHLLPCGTGYLAINTADMRTSGASAVKAKFEISARRRNQHGHERCVSCDGALFTGSTFEWGRHQFIPLDQLRPVDSPYLSNDRLLLCVSLTVLNSVAADHSWCFFM